MNRTAGMVGMLSISLLLGVAWGIWGRSGGNGGKSYVDERYGRLAVGAIEQRVDQFLLSAPTNDLSGFAHGRDAQWERTAAGIKAECRQIVCALSEISDQAIRRSLFDWVERRTFELAERVQDVREEGNYYLCTTELLDELSAVQWENEHDERLVLGLWCRQRSYYTRMCNLCEAKLASARDDYARQLSASYRLQRRMAQVGVKELTGEERDTLERLRKSDVEKKIRHLEVLRDWYRHWDVGPSGKLIMDGAVYRRFKECTRATEGE